MKKQKTSKKLILGITIPLLILLITLSVIFMTQQTFHSETSGSIISGDEQDYQCRIVMDGNVCDLYTDCQFISDRGVSCIKGYELIEFPDTPDSTESPSIGSDSSE